MSAPVRPVTELPRSVPVGLARRTMRTVHRVRTNFVFGTVLLLFAALLARLVHLQLLGAAEYRAEVAGQYRSVEVQPLRGAILDRNGRPLALSKPVRHVLVEAGGVVDPRNQTLKYAVEDVGRFAAVLSGLLDGEPETLKIRESVYRRRRQGAFGRSGSALVALRLNVDDPTLVARLDDARLPGLVVRHGDRRDYPNGSWGGLVIGRADAENAWESPRGRDGVELGLDPDLAGVVTRRTVPVDGRGRRFVTPRTVDPREDADGRTAWLALDLVVQGYCEAALDRLVAQWPVQGAVAIVMDPATGDVLAMAQRPSYDPGADGRKACANLATQWPTDVGSTFKPFTAALALDLGLVGTEEHFDLPGSREFQIGRFRTTVRDAHEGGDPSGGGNLQVALAKSNNPDHAELGRRIGQDRFRAFLIAHGVTRRFGLLGYSERERAGTVPLRSAGAGDHLRWAFGHGFTVSPLRLASMYCAFARDDLRPVRPRLVLARGGEAVPEAVDGPPIVRSQAHAAYLREALRMVVSEGTGRESVGSEKYDIAGKTGTAKRPESLGGKDSYYSCSFAGYAPADRPRFVCLVMAIEPRPGADGAKPYGGAVAGPHVRWILERALEEYAGVPPRAPAASAGEAAFPRPAADGGAATAPALIRLRGEEDR